MPNNPFYKSKFWHALRTRALKRDRYTCTTPGCGMPAVVVDHIETRPNVDHPTSVDVLEKLRSLCRRCDNQVKELGSKRKGGSAPRAIGCDADGVPNDPSHHWTR